MFQVEMSINGNPGASGVMAHYSTAAEAIRAAYLNCPKPLNAWVPDCVDDRYPFGQMTMIAMFMGTGGWCAVHETEG